jgi:hypothetical protein
VSPENAHREAHEESCQRIGIDVLPRAERPEARVNQSIGISPLTSTFPFPSNLQPQPQHCKTATPQHHLSTAAPHDRNTAAPTCLQPPTSTATPLFDRSTATLQHRSTLSCSTSAFPSRLQPLASNLSPLTSNLSLFTPTHPGLWRCGESSGGILPP